MDQTVELLPPGDPPAPFLYPFAEAQQLLDAYRLLLERTEHVLAIHDRQLDALFPVGGDGFRGQRAEEFIDVVTDLLERLHLERAELVAAIGALEDELARAGQQAARTAALQDAWRRHEQAYRQQLAAKPAPWWSEPGRLRREAS